MPVASPCIGVCVVGANGNCEGCYRTLDEIGRWSQASDAERLAIIDATIRRVCSSRIAEADIQAHLDSLCKPPGSLGELERLAFELCRIQNTVQPLASPRRVVIFAADHGVVAQGVSAWPSSVTSAVVGMMAKGKSASGVFANSFHCDYQVVDVGCSVRPVIDHSHAMLSLPVANGTADLSKGPAMTRTQFHAAWRVGKELADKSADEGMKVVSAGEMGIGNTTSAACLVTLLTNTSPGESVGRGAGVDDQGLETKRRVVQQATERAQAFVEKQDWKGVACEVGGFEIVAMASFYVRAAQRELTIVLDGYISTAAALLAEKLYPGSSRSMIASHLSCEGGHVKALEALRLTPFLDWKLRLGEGTGAILLMPMLDAAVAMLTSMATLRDVASPPSETN
jgi:nicotinate-nucleotide--dimethylbenzimidazole phosphoribosyltransferase